MTLKEFAAKAAGRPCNSCSRPLPATIEIEHYDHDGGWEVEGFAVKQWLYATCPACEYQNALWKLGIKGDENRNHGAIAEVRDAVYRHLWN